MRSGTQQSQVYQAQTESNNNNQRYQPLNSSTYNTLQNSQRNYIAEQQISVNDEEKRYLLRKIDDLETQLKLLQNQPQQYAQEISKSVYQREILQTDFGNANQTIQALQSRISELEQQNLLKNKKLDDQNKNHIYELEERVQKLQTLCDSQVIKLNNLNREKQNLISENQQLLDSIKSQNLNYKQEVSDSELRLSKESQRLSLTINDKQISLQQSEFRYNQLQDKYLQLQKKYDQDINQINIIKNDIENKLRLLQQQYDQQTELLKNINIDKQNLAIQLDKLQSESNTQIYNYQSTIKTQDSKLIRDSQYYQQQLSEKQQQINDLDKKIRTQDDRYFAFQQQYDKDIQQLNFKIQDYEQKLLILQRDFNNQTNDLNLTIQDKDRIEKSYLQLQDEINIQKLRYSQELSKTGELNSKEKQWFQLQLQDRDQSIQELEKKLKDVNYQLQTIQRRYENDTTFNNKQIVEQQDKIRNLQEQLDFKNNQYNQLIREKELLLNQFDKLQSDFNNYKNLYEIDISKLNRDNQKNSIIINEKNISQLELQKQYSQLNEEYVSLQVRFEKEINNYTKKLQDIEDDLAQMIENYKREQQINKNWEQQVITLKNQIKYQVDETRILTERQLSEKYSNLTIEQRQEFDIMQSKFNQDKSELLIQINSLRDQIRELENNLAQSNISNTKNQSLINELEAANRSLKYQVNEQESKIKSLILQEYDSLRDKSSDQTIRNLMAEIKALQNKLKKYEVYVKNIDDQKINQELQMNSLNQSNIINSDIRNSSTQFYNNNSNNYKIQQLENLLKDSEYRETQLQNKIIQIQQSQSINGDKQRIIELEEKCALLAQENQRLNLIRSKNSVNNNNNIQGTATYNRSYKQQ